MHTIQGFICHLQQAEQILKTASHIDPQTVYYVHMYTLKNNRKMTNRGGPFCGLSILKSLTKINKNRFNFSKRYFFQHPSYEFLTFAGWIRH